MVDCTSSSCSGQGTCLEVVGGGIQCVCDAGYTGNTDCTGEHYSQSQSDLVTDSASE